MENDNGGSDELNLGFGEPPQVSDADMEAALARLSTRASRYERRRNVIMGSVAAFVVVAVSIAALAISQNSNGKKSPVAGTTTTKAATLEKYTVPSSSMENTLKIGDVVEIDVNYYKSHSPARGDIIAFKKNAVQQPDCLAGVDDGQVLIKRIVGMPDETIEPSVTGGILINGKMLSEPYVKPGSGSGEALTSQTIPNDSVFAMGDNREVSRDSRCHGSVRIGSLYGYVVVQDKRNQSTTTSSSTPTSITTTTVALAVPVLGRANRFSYGKGMGAVKPKDVSYGGDGTSFTNNITWDSWGGAKATGKGTAAYLAPSAQTASEAVLAPATIVAYNLETCKGIYMYRSVDWYFPSKGDKFAHESYDLCDENNNNYDQQLTFDGLGRVGIGDSIADINAGKEVLITEDTSGDPSGACSVGTVTNVKGAVIDPSTAVPPGVSILAENHAVSRVEVTSGSAKTDSGIGIGSTEAALKKVYPSAVVTSHEYVAGGHYMIVKQPGSTSEFVFETDGKKVTQFRAGVTPAVEYVEGCA